MVVTRCQCVILNYELSDVYTGVRGRCETRSREGRGGREGGREGEGGEGGGMTVINILMGHNI